MFSLKTWVVIWVLLIGLILRFHNYDMYPQRGATSDEYTYSFLGVSLLTQGIPISWSYFSPYPVKFDLTIDNLYFPMKFPYFDHPPLNGIVVAGWALLNGEDTFAEISLSTIRLVPIFFSLISSVLLFFISHKLYGYHVALVSLLIYSSATIYSIQSRVVLAENLLTPIALLSLWLWLSWKAKMTDNKALILGIIASLSILTKELGVFVYMYLLYFFILYRLPKRFSIVLTLTVFIGGMLYVIYGAYYDWNSFISIITLQSSRDIGPQTLRLLLMQPVLVNKVYYDGWYLFGFLSFFSTVFNAQKNKELVIPALFYFLLLIFSLIREGEMGWYVIPLFPFMAIASGKNIVEGLTNRSFMIVLLLICVGLYHIEYLYETTFGLTSLQFRSMMIVLFGLPLIAYLLNESAYQKTISFFVALLFIMTIFTTYFYIHPA